MTTLAKTAARRIVRVNQIWTRRDPSPEGRTIRFIVTATEARSRFGVAVRGKTPSGKLIWCDPAAMANPADERFTLVRDAGEEKAAS